MVTLLSISFGAVLGALLRYVLAIGLTGLFAPAGTLVANGIGCFGMGIGWVLLSHYHVSDTVRLGILVGGFGALTTFSTFHFELYKMISNQQFYAAVSYFIGANVLGFGLVWLGILIANVYIS